jgi:hypothetical protein
LIRIVQNMSGTDCGLTSWRSSAVIAHPAGRRIGKKLVAKPQVTRYLQQRKERSTWIGKAINRFAQTCGKA